MHKITISFLLICLLLCGCMSNEYSFKSDNVSIVSVELLYNPYAHEGYTGKPFELICVLDQASAESFVDEIRALKTKKQHSPPPSNYGDYIAKVTYDDGDEEWFGSRHIEYVEYGSVQFGVGTYYFDRTAFTEIFLKYCEENGATVPPERIK